MINPSGAEIFWEKWKIYFNFLQFFNSAENRQEPGPQFNIKMTSYQYRKSHCGDKTVVRLSYLHKGISYTGKTSLYWTWAPFILHSQYHCCSCPGNARSQGISTHGTDLILLEYSGLNTRSVNTLRQRWNRCHFADNIFKCIFLNDNLLLSIRISLKFIPKGPINNIPALVQIMTWCRPGHKPLSEPIMIILLTHICITWPQWVNYAKIFHKWVFSSPTWSPG